MKPDATIEAQIEAAWLALLEHGGRRRFVLTSCGKLRWGREEPGTEIGTFTPAISLADFRAEVFHVYGELRVAVHHGGR